MGPAEADDGRVAVVDELDGPPALVLDPHEDNAGLVACGQLLVGLVPANQGDLKLFRKRFNFRRVYLVDTKCLGNFEH